MNQSDKVPKEQDSVTPKTLKAKEYHERYFRSRALKELVQINNQPVTVFVCGPNGGDNPLKKKRSDTINELKKLGHDANSGEELVNELKALDVGSEKTPNVYENIAAIHSDFIIIFCASPGSIGETHEFLAIPDIARKTLVFIDKEFHDGYTRKGILEMHKQVHGLVEEYEKTDITSCNLMTSAINWVKNFQSTRWMQQHKIIES
jgi:hypothetical protein